MSINRFEKLSLEELEALKYCIHVFSETFDPYDEEAEQEGRLLFKIREELDLLIGGIKYDKA